VGFDEPETPRLYADRCVVEGISFVNRPFDGVGEACILAQPRYRTAAVPVVLETDALENRKAFLRFEEPQRALTPGQICAFYRGEELLGGGVFGTIEHGD